MGNGDKPGIGFALMEIDGKIASGKFYILDPNRPGDFAKGREINLEDLENVVGGIRFRLKLNDQLEEKEEMKLLNFPTKERTFKAILVGQSGDRDVEFTFGMKGP